MSDQLTDGTMIQQQSPSQTNKMSRIIRSVPDGDKTVVGSNDGNRSNKQLLSDKRTSQRIKNHTKQSSSNASTTSYKHCIATSKQTNKPSHQPQHHSTLPRSHSSGDISTLFHTADEYSSSATLRAKLFILHTIQSVHSHRYLIGMDDALIYCLEPKSIEAQQYYIQSQHRPMSNQSRDEQLPHDGIGDGDDDSVDEMNNSNRNKNRSTDNQSPNTSEELQQHILTAQFAHAVDLNTVKLCLHRHNIQYQTDSIYADVSTQAINQSLTTTLQLPTSINKRSSSSSTDNRCKAITESTLSAVQLNIKLHSSVVPHDVVWYNVSQQQILLVHPLIHPVLGVGFIVSICTAPCTHLPINNNNSNIQQSQLSNKSMTMKDELLPQQSSPQSQSSLSRVYRKRNKPVETVGELLDRLAEYQRVRDQMGSKNLACAALGLNKATINSYQSAIQQALDRNIPVNDIRHIRIREFKLMIADNSVDDTIGELHDTNVNSSTSGSVQQQHSSVQRQLSSSSNNYNNNLLSLHNTQSDSTEIKVDPSNELYSNRSAFNVFDPFQSSLLHGSTSSIPQPVLQSHNQQPNSIIDPQQLLQSQLQQHNALLNQYYATQQQHGTSTQSTYNQFMMNPALYHQQAAAFQQQLQQQQQQQQQNPHQQVTQTQSISITTPYTSQQQQQ